MYHAKELLSSINLNGRNTIPSTDSKLLEQLVQHVTNTTTGHYCTVAFI